MRINRIIGEECKTAHLLWEEVFYEDSTQFTDYYFENKAEKNIGYVIGQVPYDAMMFRTPYRLQIGEVQREISYLVGVATRKECRHRGYMRELLMHSFREMYEEKMPFAFLMPANSAIYEPFDFRYIYKREVWELKGTFKEYTNIDKLHGLYSVRYLYEKCPQLPILSLLAEFANRYLRERYNIYVHRDVSYYEMQLKESEAQNGDIYVFFENGEIKAFFLYAKEGEEIYIQEVMEETEGILNFLQKAEKKKPIIMARIIHLEEMMKLICSKENTSMMIEIEDELIPENAGIYWWKMTPKGSKVTKIKSNAVTGISVDLKAAEKETEMLKEKAEGAEMEGIVPEVSMHIRELASWILTGVFINEIV